MESVASALTAVQIDLEPAEQLKQESHLRVPAYRFLTDLALN